MKLKFKAAVGSLLIGAAVAGAAVMPAAGQAAEPGQVCNLGPGWPGIEVRSTSSGPGVIYYHMYSGEGFRIVAYGANNTYYGHGNGKRDGYLWRDVINQSSCHW